MFSKVHFSNEHWMPASVNQAATRVCTCMCVSFDVRGVRLQCCKRVKGSNSHMTPSEL